jgi:hypothetical protein
MKQYNWDSYFVELFDACVDEYDEGNHDPKEWFADEDLDYLRSIGSTEREFFDLVEDNVSSGGADPTAITALLITAVRRDYFLTVQKGVLSQNTVHPDELPAKTAEAHGIPWLPRITAKAQAKLRGEMHPDIMYGCGGDRAFLTQHDMHPADFLRQVWAAKDDAERIYALFVKKA